MRRILNCDDPSFNFNGSCDAQKHVLCKRCNECYKYNEEIFQQCCDDCLERCPGCNGTCSKCHLLCDNRREDYHNESRFIK